MEEASPGNVAPRILSRPEHIISRKNIDPEALKVLYRLKNHGFVAYLVGGGVRDLLLGRQPKDFDVATDGHRRETDFFSDQPDWCASLVQLDDAAHRLQASVLLPWLG